MIKKAIYLFSILVSLSIFILNFSLFSNTEKQKIASPPDIILNQSNRGIISMSLNTTGGNKEQMIKDLVDFANESDTYLLVPMKESVMNTYIRNSYFLYSTDENFLLDIFTKENQKVDYHKLEGKYLTTDNMDELAYDKIDYINSNNHKVYNSVIELKQFDLMKDRLDGKENIYVYCYTKEVADAKNMIENSKLLSAYNPIIMNDEYYPPEYKLEYNDWMRALLCISAICLFMCYLQLLFTNKREIQIRKLMGNSLLEICKALFLKTLLCAYVVFILVQIISYAGMIGSIRPITKPFLICLLSYLIMFTLLTILIMILIFIYMNSMNEIGEIKKRSSTKKILKLSFLSKIIILLITLPFLIPLSDIFFNNLSLHRNLNKFEKNLNNKLYPSQFEQSSKVSMNEMIVNVYDRFIQLGATYFNVEIQDDSPIISANANYFSDYELRDEANNVIETKYLTTGTLLLDISFKGKEEEITGKLDFENIIYVKNLPPLTNQNAFEVEIYKSVPVLIQNEYIGQPWNYPYLLLKNTDENIEKLDRFFVSQKLEGLVKIENSSNMYQINKERATDELRYSSLSLMVFVFASFASLNLLLNLLLHLDRYEFSLNYLLGSGYFATYNRILPYIIIPYIVSIMVLYLQTSNSAKHLYLIFFLLCIELLYVVWYINRFEKREILDTLKHFES